MKTLREEALELAGVFEQAREMVFLGGAGVSTESGVPDYRSAGGLYSNKFKCNVEGNKILSGSFLREDPQTHFSYYKGRLVHPLAEPNKAHISLAELERLGILKMVITQNIDGLHQKAGSCKVYEMHGSMWRNYCTACGAFYTLSYVMNTATVIPHCRLCGGMVRPDTVLYEEPLDTVKLKEAIALVKRVDTMLVGGTALAVNPARGLVKYFRGSRLVFLNHDPTALDHRATLLIRNSIGEVMEQALDIWKKQ